jgi:tryptophan 2,3-dioxygenase
MEKSGLDPKIVEQIKKLEAKYEVMGQDLSSYLDGLLYADYLTYWDYIHLDTLLSLQNPKTSFKDEPVFIVYHQITELYFKLILLEMEQIAFHSSLSEEFFLARLQRINRYFEQLTNSFDIMVDGMEKEQFLKFRMALLPASGFQSAQYRLIEMASTDLFHLLLASQRENHRIEDSVEKLIEKIYWKEGATELASGKKTLTLRQFEEKYMERFIKQCHEYRANNLYALFRKNFTHLGPDSALVQELRKLDVLANITWRLAHYKSAVRYLHKDPEFIAATGGTNWQKYLPPRFQKVIFFPSLWSEDEKDNWGKQFFVKEALS